MAWNVTQMTTGADETTVGINETSINYTWRYLSQLQQQENLGRFHQQVLVTGSLCVASVGLITNLLSLIVLCRKDMKATTYTFLIGLAISDLTVIVTGTMLSCLSTIVNVDVEILAEGKYLPVIFPFLRPAASSCIFVSIWITVALSADRYLAVCHHNMRIHTCCTVPIARKITIFIFVTSILYNIPTFFEYQVEFVFISQLNKTVAVYGVTEWGADPLYRQVYRSWLLMPVMFVVPFLLLTFMNTRLIIVVLRTRQRAPSIGKARPSGLDVTVMLIGVVVLFLLCQSPLLVSTVMWAVVPDSVSGLVYMKFTLVAVLLVLINSSSNFFVLTLCGRRFRRKFKEVFCNCRCFDVRERRKSYFSQPSHDLHTTRRQHMV